jgi:hypothetical protein
LRIDMLLEVSAQTWTMPPGITQAYFSVAGAQAVSRATSQQWWSAMVGGQAHRDWNASASFLASPPKALTARSASRVS